MPSCRKRRHVGADFGQNDFGRHSAHARDRDQSCDRVAKRRKQLLDASVEVSDVSLQLLDQAKMMSDQEAMMREYKWATNENPATPTISTWSKRRWSI